MKFIADFHIHSKYSRATSKDMDLENLDKWAAIKGIKILGTGDFTHPDWFRILTEKLEPAEEGLYRLKSKFQNSASGANKANPKDEMRFILTSEISCIYKKENRVRKVHILIFAPSFSAVLEINKRLGSIGNLKSDGRPILGLDAKELAKIALDVSQDCVIIPAHAWTPWFSIFGSKSGFDTIKECFDEYSKYIFALETGLSSDPAMNRRLSGLDDISLISNSDAHSPRKIGREANVFDTEISYSAIIDAIKKKDPAKFLYTVEFFPEEGKYHYDGHRFCGIVLSPKETKKYNGVCPSCGKPLTVGVLSRVEELADREDGVLPKNSIPFKNLIPLEEIIADALGFLPGGKQVEAKYLELIKKFGNEFAVLTEISFEDLKTATIPRIAEGIIRARDGRVNISPGYDGVYGKIKIFSEAEKTTPIKQKTLF